MNDEEYNEGDVYIDLEGKEWLMFRGNWIPIVADNNDSENNTVH